MLESLGSQCICEGSLLRLRDGTGRGYTPQGVLNHHHLPDLVGVASTQAQEESHIGAILFAKQEGQHAQMSPVASAQNFLELSPML